MYVANLEHVPPHEKCRLFEYFSVPAHCFCSDPNKCKWQSNQGTNSFVCNKMSELPKVINFKDLTSANTKL
jgi:hypothetical protein